MNAHDNEKPSPLDIRSTKPDQTRKPDLQQVNSTVLDEGPRSRKEMVHYAISSRNTGEFKGNKIGFRTRHKKQGMWENDAAKSFTLETEEQISRAIQFISASCGKDLPNFGGNFLLLPIPEGGDITSLQRMLRTVSQDGKANLLVDLLDQASHSPEILNVITQRASHNPERYIEAAATLNLARFRKALNTLNDLIANSNREHDFQSLLTENPWMFGSEYSERLPRREWVRDSQTDFMLRRTTDNFIEIIEIKTPLNGKDLFRFDPSHRSFYAGVDLSAVIGQVQKYIADFDSDRHRIKSYDGEDTEKIRAKIIIGRDGNAEQRQALRRFNGHLHRIEVLTFDQLSRVAQRVVSYLEELISSGKSAQYDDSEEIPF